MRLHQLPKPSRRAKKRVGRGHAAGQGTTAGRGTKGQKARTGFNFPRRFEGGQTPLIQRLPKRRGFRSLVPRAITLRIDRILAKIQGDRISPKLLIEAGLVKKREVGAGGIRIVGMSSQLRPLKWTKEIHVSHALMARLQELKGPHVKAADAVPKATTTHGD